MLRRTKIAKETLIVVVVILLIRLAMDYFSIEPLTLGVLLTSFFTGGIFLVGFILAGTVTDYKESDRLPAELATALHNIHAKGVLFKKKESKFNLARLDNKLKTVVSAIESDFADKGVSSRQAIRAVSDLSESLQEMEQLGMLPNYMVRLEGEQSALLKGLLRAYHIQRTQFLPSALFLVESVVFLIIGLLLLTKIEPAASSFVIIGFASYLFIYILKLIKELNKPFRVGEDTQDDVSLFLLREFKKDVERKPNGPAANP